MQFIIPPMKPLTTCPAVLISCALAMVVTPGFAQQTGQSPAAMRSAENKSAIYLPAAAEAPATAAMPLRPGPHLFLDESLIENSSNVTRRVNVPSRDPAIPNPLVTGKEDACFQPYLTVLRDPQTGRFRLWYGAHTADFNSSRSHLGYLESADRPLPRQTSRGR